MEDKLRAYLGLKLAFLLKTSLNRLLQGVLVVTIGITTRCPSSHLKLF